MPSPSFRDTERIFTWCQVSHHNGVNDQSVPVDLDKRNGCLRRHYAFPHHRDSSVALRSSLSEPSTNSAFSISATRQVNFGEGRQSDSFLNRVVSQWASYRCGCGFSLRSLDASTTVASPTCLIDAVIQCLERIHFMMAQQRLLDTIPGQFCIQECFCTFSQFFGSTRPLSPSGTSSARGTV